MWLQFYLKRSSDGSKNVSQSRLPACKFFLNQPVQVSNDGWLVKALNNFIQKSGDDEALGNGDRNPASAEVKEFVLLNLAGSRAMSATDVVGENFEARH